MEPGNYSGNHVINYDKVMNPGLYCIDGNITINADYFTATHVTLYKMTGKLDIDGGSLH